MSWEQATFRGIPFNTDSLERGGGRRGVTHEFPRNGKEQALSFREDLGLKTRTFPVEGYVIGDKYLSQRNALITALEDIGPGELVHPTYGKLRVAVVSYRVREESNGLRRARFSIEFEETPTTNTQPVGVVDTASKLATSAENARAAVQSEFLAKYSPSRLVSSLTAQLQSWTDEINSAANKARVASGTETQAFARLKRSAVAFEAAIGTLVGSPDDLLESISDLYDLVDSRVALVQVYAFNAGTRPPATTPSREAEQICFDALQYLTQRLAVVRAAELIVAETFDSYDEAVAARDELTGLLDEQAETVSDDTFPALMQLRADLVIAVPGTDSDLASLVKFTPLVTAPSLVLAFQLYGDVTKEADIIARNNVKNPCFVPGGRELEVLSSG